MSTYFRLSNMNMHVQFDYIKIFNGVMNHKHIRQREQFVKLCRVVDIDVNVARKASGIYTDLKTGGA